jgi:hypothetical protein
VGHGRCRTRADWMTCLSRRVNRAGGPQQRSTVRRPTKRSVRDRVHDRFARLAEIGGG